MAPMRCANFSRLVAPFALLLLAGCNEEAAGPVALPAIEFTAEAKICTSIKAEETCSTLSVQYMPTRWRVDWTSVRGLSTTEIYDAAKGTITTVEYPEKQYSVESVDVRQKAGYTPLLPPLDLLGERIGEEEVGGRRTVKYRFTLKGAAGEMPTRRTWWLTKENIVVREESETRDGDNVDRSLMEVTKLTIGPFDPKLLEVPIPPGFTRIEKRK